MTRARPKDARHSSKKDEEGRKEISEEIGEPSS